MQPTLVCEAPRPAATPWSFIALRLTLGRIWAGLRALATDPALQQAVALVVALRVSLGFVAWESLRLWPIRVVDGEWVNLLLPSRHPLASVVGVWQRWDALWYEHLATSGYRYGNFDVNFFPLFPGLMHVVGALFGGSYALAGLVISTVAFTAGLVLLHRLVAGDFDEPTARRTVLYLALAPLAFFFLAPYTEALFLFLSVAAFLAARRGHFVLAGLAAALASVCRLQGIILLLPLAIEVCRDAAARTKQGQPLFRPSYAAILLAPAALGWFYLYGDITMGVPGGFLEGGAAHWGHRVVGIWSALADSFRVSMAGRRPEEILNLAAVVGTVICLPFMFARLPLAYSAYSAAMLLPVVFQEAYVTPLMSASRYVVVVFPVYVLLARAGRREWFDRLMLGISPVMMGVLLAHFVHFGWIA